MSCWMFCCLMCFFSFLPRIESFEEVFRSSKGYRLHSSAFGSKSTTLIKNFIKTNLIIFLIFLKSKVKSEGQTWPSRSSIQKYLSGGEKRDCYPPPPPTSASNVSKSFDWQVALVSELHHVGDDVDVSEPSHLPPGPGILPHAPEVDLILRHLQEHHPGGAISRNVSPHFQVKQRYQLSKSINQHLSIALPPITTTVKFRI